MSSISLCRDPSVDPKCNISNLNLHLILVTHTIQSKGGNGSDESKNYCFTLALNLSQNLYIGTGEPLHCKVGAGACQIRRELIIPTALKSNLEWEIRYRGGKV
jgi:hypothetical protein